MRTLDRVYLVTWPRPLRDLGQVRSPWTRSIEFSFSHVDLMTGDCEHVTNFKAVLKYVTRLRVSMRGKDKWLTPYWHISYNRFIQNVFYLMLLKEFLGPKLRSKMTRTLLFLALPHIHQCVWSIPLLAWEIQTPTKIHPIWDNRKPKSHPGNPGNRQYLQKTISLHKI